MNGEPVTFARSANKSNRGFKMELGEKPHTLFRVVCVCAIPWPRICIWIQVVWPHGYPACTIRDDIKECFRKYCTHMALMVPFHVFIPKHHLCLHLIYNLPLHGNPMWYANWRDESLNKVLKACCRNVSQRTFEVSLLLRMRELISDASTLKRGRG